ncbi:unnamed protein product, partial [marine sediment metagenome]
STGLSYLRDRLSLYKSSDVSLNKNYLKRVVLEEL